MELSVKEVYADLDSSLSAVRLAVADVDQSFNASLNAVQLSVEDADQRFNVSVHGVKLGKKHTKNKCFFSGQNTKGPGEGGICSSTTKKKYIFSLRAREYGEETVKKIFRLCQKTVTQVC